MSDTQKDIYGLFLKMSDRDCFYDSVFHALADRIDMHGDLQLEVHCFGEGVVNRIPLPEKEYPGIREISHAYTAAMNYVLENNGPLVMISAGYPKLDYIMFRNAGYEPVNYTSSVCYVDRALAGSKSSTLSLHERDHFREFEFLKKFLGSETETHWMQLLVHQNCL